jgi:Tfp pilus assembly protein PilF
MSMTRFLRSSVAIALLVATFAAGCSSSRGPADSQEKFGVRMARMNLWREALFRFRRAVEMDPSNAMAHNNLAVALEANGDFENAAKQYREAMRLDKSNPFIQKNYSRFVEFTSRNRKREQQKKRESAPPATEAALTPPTAGQPAEPAPAEPPAPATPEPAPVPAEPQPEPQPQPQPPTPPPPPVPQGVSR